MAPTYEKGRREPGWRLVIALSAAIALIYVLSVGWFYNFQQGRLFAERQVVFTQFAEKTAENIDQAIDDYWHRNGMCREYLALAAPSSEKALIDSLLYCSETITSGQAVVMAFTEDGFFFSSDGHTGFFGQDGTVSFAPEAPNRQTGIVNLPYESTERTYFLLFEGASKPLEVPGVGTITHLALAIDVDSLQNLFATHGFGENCHTYFVTETGRRLYQSSDSHTFIEGYNVLTAVEDNAEVTGGGSMADLLASFESGDTTAFEISYHEESWFVSFQTVSSGEHRLVVFAPTDLIGNNAAKLSGASLWFLLFTCALLGLLFLMVVVWVRSMMRRLRELNVLLEREAQAADAANRAKSEFLSHMSHDIRTPINGIMGMTGIAMKNGDDLGRVMRCLEKIDEASRHLLSLVNDVLDLSRIEQGRTAIVCEPVALPALLEECASIVEGQLATRNLEFVRDFDNLPCPHVLTDELHLRQILINILGNAVKFTPDGGSVTLRARQEALGGGRVAITLSVEDTGIGMEQSYLEHIWEPFSQSQQGHCGAYEGTGLGMAITKRFVDMMGGNITVESALGSGSTFTVTLTVDVNEGEGHLAGAGHGADVDGTTLEGLRVLLVEDKELNREIAREALESAGAIVSCAEDGKEALEAFATNPAGSYDVILMDVMMPVMNGLEATRAIRALDRADAARVPIVALTAHAFEEDVRKTREAGMDFHLSKPIDERSLVKALARYRVQPAERAAKAEGALEGLHALLAEDDELNREIACALLEERGVRVAAVPNGRLALEAFASSPEGSFDLVLMDLHMPVMDGVEAVRRIRALDRADAARVPMFALTADYSVEEGRAMEQAGVDQPLLKPLDMGLLAEALAATRR